MKSKISFILFLLASLIIFFLVPQSVKAQFTGELGSISGTIYWGTELPNSGFTIKLVGNTTGFSLTKYAVGYPGFETGFNLPPDTYTVTVSHYQIGAPNNIGHFLKSQTVTVGSGQAVTANFDISDTTGFVKGNLIINGVLSGGLVQFCGPLETDPCPIPSSYWFDPNHGPFMEFGGSSGFKFPVPPGNYRVHVVTGERVDMGTIPITVTAGEVINLPTTAVYVSAGQNVTASLAGVTITFTEVTASGFMVITVTDNPQGGLPPSAFRFLGTYYELTTTATYTGPITISITYNQADVRGKEENLKLFHWDGTNWQNITTSVDTVNNIITGVSPTISPFVIGEPIDTTPPATTITPNGALGNNGWYTSNVSITLSASDGEGLGVEETEYSLDGGTTWATYTSSFIITTEGTTLVKARSVDIAGNIESPIELSVKIDKNGPTIDISPTGTLGGNNWYISDVALTLSAEDPISGMDSIEYSADDGVTWTSYISAFTVGKEGITNIKSRSSDIAGNISIPADFTIKIDKIEPAITDFQLSSFVIAKGSTATILVQASDATSGISSVSYLLDDGASGSGVLVFDASSGTWQANISPTTGVYSIRVEATDISGHKQVSGPLYLAVYDPMAGFVTGGGWFIPDDTSRIGVSASGKANLGFEVKYQAGSLIPQGNLTFHYPQDSLKLKSTSLQWLAVTGSTADFQGNATIDGGGEYVFRVHIVDGSPDQFEIRIWTSDRTFDNPTFRASNNLSHGSIVIH